MTKTRQWSVLTVVAVVVVMAAGWFMLVKPQKSNASDLRAQAVTQQQANQLLQTQIAAVQAEEKGLPQQQRKLQKFSTQVPNDAAEPTLIRQLSAAAVGSGVDLSSLTPAAATAVSAGTTGTTLAPTTTTSAGSAGTPAAAAAAPAASLQELPVAITISGRYPDIESFFQSLEKLPRSILVTGWSLSASSGSTSSGSTTTPAGTLTGTLSTDVFFSSTAAPTTGATTLTPSTTASTGTAGSTPAATTTPAAAK